MIYRMLFISIVVSLVLSSCGGNKGELKDKGISEHTLGLVDSDLTGDGDGLLEGMPQYSLTAAGMSEKVVRAFENAPPMIPHMTEGFFPITRANNICLTCHMPDKAEEVKSVAIPRSHFIDYRPGIVYADGKYTVNAEEGEVVSKDLGDQLSHTRFNCDQCHVPQANVTVDIRNTFETVFRDKLDAEKSNLDLNIAEGVK